VLAAKLLAEETLVADDTIVFVGHGFGAILVPRIAGEAGDLSAGLILIGSRPISYARQLLMEADFSDMEDKERDAFKELAWNIGSRTEEQARKVELFGRNGYYFWEMEQVSHIVRIMRLGLPTYIVQGRDDAHVSEKDGWRAYAEELKNYGHITGFNSYRGLNHMLANDLSVDENGKPQYALDAGIDVPAVRDLANWILALLPEQEAAEVE
jgi:pimeloyl-ACP methyl ester carboxylesterase